MDDLDDLEVIMARLAAQQQTSSAPATTTTATAQQQRTGATAAQQHQSESSSSDSDSDEDALAALRKGAAAANKKPKLQAPPPQPKQTASENEKTNNQKEKLQQDAAASQQQHASSSFLDSKKTDSSSSSSLSSMKHLPDELHIASRSHNAISEPDKQERLEKWKKLVGHLNPGNPSGSTNYFADAFLDNNSLARYGETFLQAWSLPTDTLLMRRARSILVSEMLYLMEIERDEGRRKRVSASSSSLTQESSSSLKNLVKAAAKKKNNNNKNDSNNTSQNKKKNAAGNTSTITNSTIEKRVTEVIKNQINIESQHFSHLPPPTTLEYSPCSDKAQECLRAIHEDRFACPDKWLFLLKEIRQLPLTKVRHIWQYAIKTFPSTTWLVCDYLSLEIEAEEQLLTRVMKNEEHQQQKLKEQPQKDHSVLFNQEQRDEEWLACLTSRLRILDTFEAHLRVCTASAQLHTLFIKYCWDTVGNLDSLTAMSISNTCIKQVGRCYDAYCLWKEVLSRRRGLADDKSVRETRKLFHLLLETPMDELEQGKTEYLQFEEWVRTSGRMTSGAAAASSSDSRAALTLPQQLQQTFRTAYDEYNFRKHLWDIICQRQRWLGNLKLRAQEEFTKKKEQLALLIGQQGKRGSAAASALQELMRRVSENMNGSTEDENEENDSGDAAGLQGGAFNKLRRKRDASTDTASVAHMAQALLAEEGKIPASRVEEAIYNALPSVLPVQPGSVLNLSKQDDDAEENEIGRGSYQFFKQRQKELYAKKKLLLRLIKQNDNNNGDDDDESTFDQVDTFLDSIQVDFFLELVLEELNSNNKDEDHTTTLSNSSSDSLNAKLRSDCLEEGKRILSYHSAWDALIEVEENALKTLLLQSAGNMSGGSGAPGASSDDNNTTAFTLLHLIQNANSSLKQVAVRCRKIAHLWEQRCRCDPHSLPSNWLSWARARSNFAVAKIKMSMDSLSQEERRNDLLSVVEVYVEAVSRFPDNLVLVNALADLLVSVGDATTANSLFFALSQQSLNQAKLMFMYEQENSLNLKYSSLLVAHHQDSSSNLEETITRTKQQLNQVQRQRIQKVCQLMQNRNVQVFCELIEQQEQQQSAEEQQAEVSTTEGQEDSSSLINIPSSKHQKLLTLRQYLVPLCWRFCDRPSKSSDSVLASVMANPFQSATMSLFHVLGRGNRTQQQENFQHNVVTYLTCLRNQLKDNITLSIVNWMKWLLRSRNTRFWTRGITGFAEVSSDMDSTLLHLRSVAKYAVTACGIARHPLFLHSWVELEASSCGSDIAGAAEAVQQICDGWKKNICSTIVGIGRSLLANASSSTGSSFPRRCHDLDQAFYSIVSSKLTTSSSTSSNGLLSDVCGVDTLFFDAIKILDYLRSASPKDSSSGDQNNNKKNLLLQENSIRFELASLVFGSVIEPALRQLGGSNNNHDDALATTLLNAAHDFVFSSSSRSESSCSTNGRDLLQSVSPSSSPVSTATLTPTQILQRICPNIFSLCEETRSLVQRAQTYRQHRLFYSNGNSNNTFLFSQLLQTAMSSSHVASAMRSSLNVGEIRSLLFGKNHTSGELALQDDDDEDENENFEVLCSNNNSNSFSSRIRSRDPATTTVCSSSPEDSTSSALSSSASSIRPNFNFFTKYVDGTKMGGGRGGGVKLETPKSDAASPSSPSLQQFILPHLMKTSNNTNPKTNNNNKNPANAKIEAREKVRQIQREQEQQLIKSVLSSRGATDFYSTELIDNHRRNLVFGWPAVLARLKNSVNLSKTKTTASVKSVEEDLLAFRLTLPVYAKTRTANASLMNPFRSVQADLDADAMANDLTLRNEKILEESNQRKSLQDAKRRNNNNNKSELELKQEQNLVYQFVKEGDDADRSISAVDEEDATAQTGNNNTEDDDLLGSSTAGIPTVSQAAWDNFAGRFSSSALFRLLHRLPSSHGIGYAPSVASAAGEAAVAEIIAEKNKLKKEEENGSENGENETEQHQVEEDASTDFDLTKSAYQLVGGSGDTSSNAARALKRDSHTGRLVVDPVDTYPTTKFVMESMLNTYRS